MGTPGEPQTARQLQHLIEGRREKSGGSVSDTAQLKKGREDAHYGRKVITLYPATLPHCLGEPGNGHLLSSSRAGLPEGRWKRGSCGKLPLVWGQQLVLPRALCPYPEMALLAPGRLCSFPMAAVREYHKLGSLKHLKFAQAVEVRSLNQGVRRALLLGSFQRRICPASSCFWKPGCFLACGHILPGPAASALTCYCGSHLFLQGHQSNGIRFHPNSMSPYLDLHLQKHYFQVRSHPWESGFRL